MHWIKRYADGFARLRALHRLSCMVDLPQYGIVKLSIGVQACARILWAVFLARFWVYCLERFDMKIFDIGCGNILSPTVIPILDVSHEFR